MADLGLNVTAMLSSVYETSVGAYARKTKALENVGQIDHLKANILWR